MTLPLGQAISYYFDQDFKIYYLVTEDFMFQFSERYFLLWPEETDLTKWKRKQLSEKRPLNHSEGEYVLSLLISYLIGCRDGASSSNTDETDLSTIAIGTPVHPAGSLIEQNNQTV